VEHSDYFPVGYARNSRCRHTDCGRPDKQCTVLLLLALVLHGPSHPSSHTRAVHSTAAVGVARRSPVAGGLMLAGNALFAGSIYGAGCAIVETGRGQSRAMLCSAELQHSTGETGGQGRAEQ
jgi:hypothetical protein